MTKTIDFYFDIISPYSYLAHKKIKKNYKDKKINFNYKPILLGGLHKLAEITAPAFNKFKMNNMRGYLLVDNELKEEFLDKFFDAYWKNNKDLSIKENFNEVLKDLKINSDNYFNDIQNEKIKDELKIKTSEAFDKEVFGAPTFIVNDKLFWGQDRLEYAVDELKN